MRENERALAEVVDDERRQHEREPGGLDRLAAEVAEIGVERLGAGHGEEDEAEDREADQARA